MSEEMKKAKEIIHKLSKWGNTYIVGGAVRDHLLGKDPYDVDLCTNVPMDKIEKLFPTHDIGANKDFGILVIEYKNSIFEIAQFRTETSYSDGRRPEHVNFVDNIKEDLSRRDLTCNSMAMTIDEQIIDPFNGSSDLKSRSIRTVGNPYKRFEEDHLRMIRCCRFASVLGFNINDEVFHAIQTMGYRITDIAVERIVQEVQKVCVSGGRVLAEFIKRLKYLNLLPYTFPEILALDFCEHDPEDHPDGNVFEHTMKMLELSDSTDFETLMSILFHDIGKINTHKLKTRQKHIVKYGVHAKAKNTYDNHHQTGVAIFERIADRMKLDNETRKCVLFSIKNHMKFINFAEMKDSTILKLVSDKHFDTLMVVSELDNKSQGDGIYAPEHYDEIRKRILHVKGKYMAQDHENNIKKRISGDLVMNIRGILPGPEVGEVIRRTTIWILDNNIGLHEIARINNFIRIV